MAATSDSTLVLPSLNPTPGPYAAVSSRKYSAPAGPYAYQSNVTDSYLYRNGSPLPMPPNYNEGSCWTLASLSSLNPSALDIRSRKTSVQVTKISLRMDGRWAREKPYVIDKTWDEWLDLRERIVQRYPETECILPKLSKTHGFLESIFTNSKRGSNGQSVNVKELNNFLSRLVTKCSKKVIDSRIVQHFFQTEEMRAGVYQVEYADEEITPFFKAPTPLNTSSDVSVARDEANFIASHLQAFRFPEPNVSTTVNPSHPNLAPWNQAVGAEGEGTMNEKASPRYNRGKRATDPMTVIDELITPPGSAQEPQATLWTSAKMTQKSRHQIIRPNTAVAPTVPVVHPKRPYTSDSPRQHGAMLRHAASTNFKPLPSSVARRPSENLPAGYSREFPSQQPSRPQLKEFKSMQDIRTAAGSMKATGRTGRKGMVDTTRNNYVSGVGENAQLGAGRPNHWRRHQRSPSECSSSFSSSQLSPISSVLSSPTGTPSNSTNALLELISNQRVPPKIAWRRSIDSLGPLPDDPISLGLFHESDLGRALIHETHPALPAIPPVPNHFVSSSALKRPHTSADNGKVFASNNTLTLKVTHPESKTNIILSIQKGSCSLQEIKTKIENKIKLAADIHLDPNWKIKLTMIDQEEVVRKDHLFDWKDSHLGHDDGLKLLHLVNLRSLDYSVKKITLRIC